MQQLLNWSPLVLVLLVWIVWMRRAMGRQGSMIEVGRENTQAVKENTEVLKAILAKLEDREKS